MRNTLAARSKAEVWGQPVAHSLSPTLHNAAYGVLGLEAHYDRREVSQDDLRGALELVDDSYLGVSLTMPLKEAILSLVPDHRGLVDVLGAANTVVATNQGLYLENTDPFGVIGALKEAQITDVRHTLLLGAGATARSVLSALSTLGGKEVTIAARDEGRSAGTLALARDLGLHANFLALGDIVDVKNVSLVASTLPTGVDGTSAIPHELVSHAALFDVTYHPWPTPLAALWSGSPKPVASGLSMLTHQALIQVRLFISGAADVALPREAEALRAMKTAVGLPTV
jgi:shikimate dehydrogenase